MDLQILHDAMLATARKRRTEKFLKDAAEVLDEVEDSPVMQKLWLAYQKKFAYASDLNWIAVMAAVRKLYAKCERNADNEGISVG